MKTTTQRRIVGGLLLACLGGCATNPKVSPDAGTALGMLAVRSIQIQPFTKIRSFDADATPDGIGVVLRPADQFGDPVKIMGHLYFELYAYRPASGEPKGERLEFWDRTLATADDVKLYWDRTAQMYEFPLAWTQGLPPTPSRKYLLTVSYRTPWDETLEDQYELELAMTREQVTGAAER